MPNLAIGPAPRSQAQIDDIKKKVLVHCRFGIGRSGTVIAAWLLKQGYPLDKALKLLRHDTG